VLRLHQLPSLQDQVQNLNANSHHRHHHLSFSAVMQLRWVYKLQRPAKSIGSIAVGQEKQKSDLPCSWDIEPFRRGAGSRLMQNQQSLPLVQLLLLLVQLLLPLVHQHFPLIENSRHAAILWRIRPSLVLLQPIHPVQPVVNAPKSAGAY
jgi:hypothetical protein